ncbi:biotin---protein ligase [Marchantia polymorpha subsp. ruderalis]|uniref:BPL/LPL catalytic domain-containing protein n=2 Tax=Marchantia polymorpha TaxID=3197 RepID=A0AAF6B4L6_MARPO|nr:hypothetical protein MARPO_0100s0036 [Marchantia polymorpha]BBN06950.1 hypothetical protein Mp_3g25230 [Marchantia polymorpha subsp. ruderalis]|eukprot:PTQ32328.1 hypothetical protein MARPO_0100s0036 [Marchantia polymorpha]
MFSKAFPTVRSIVGITVSSGRNLRPAATVRLCDRTFRARRLNSQTFHRLDSVKRDKGEEELKGLVCVLADHSSGTRAEVDSRGAAESGDHQAIAGLQGAEQVLQSSNLGEARGRESGTAIAAAAARLSVEGEGGTKGSFSVGAMATEAAHCRIYLAAKNPRQAELIPGMLVATELKLPEGAQLLATPDASDVDSTVTELFDVIDYLKNLRTSQFGAFALYSPLIPSTHTLLSQNFKEFPEGSICIAGAQLQGKGRAGNVWESPKGCLMFSFTIKMTNGRLVPFLQYVVSLAVVEAFEEICKAKGIAAPEVRIKWPNDLYAKGLKVGGVLCTSTYSAKTFNIVVGVGLNVGNRVPTTCLDALIQEVDPHASALSKEQLLAAIMMRFEELNSKFTSHGFTPLRDSYYDKWLHTGQTVVLEEKDPESSEMSHVPLTIRGLSSRGYLYAIDERGEQYELHPDGNSFDFLKGLVRTKLEA